MDGEARARNQPITARRLRPANHRKTLETSQSPQDARDHGGVAQSAGDLRAGGLLGSAPLRAKTLLFYSIQFNINKYFFCSIRQLRDLVFRGDLLPAPFLFRLSRWGEEVWSRSALERHISLLPGGIKDAGVIVIVLTEPNKFIDSTFITSIPHASFMFNSKAWLNIN